MHPDQVLIRVHAASIDLSDVAILSGLGRYERKGHPRTRSSQPVGQKDSALVLGRDVSGTLVEVGLNVNHLNVGDAVWAAVPLLERGGSIADFVVLSGERVRRKPINVGHEGAATVPYSGGWFGW